LLLDTPYHEIINLDKVEVYKAITIINLSYSDNYLIIVILRLNLFNLSVAATNSCL